MRLVILFSSLYILFVTKASANPAILARSSSVSDSGIVADTSVNCPPGYSQPTNSNWDQCYKVYAKSVNRKDASAQCSSDNGTLSSVKNAFVNAHLYSLASKAGATALWLGIECFNGDKTECETDDGSPFKYDNFYPGQPSPIDMCVYMSTIGRDSQSWSTFDCEQTFNFACEVAAVTAGASTVPPQTITTQKPRICPGDYTLFNNQCYKIFYNPVGQSHDEFTSVCKQIGGGRLASIPSKEVDDYLQNLQSDCPHGFTYTIGLQCRNVTSNGDTRGCTWDDGTTFGYSNFVQGQPLADGFDICPYVFNGVWHGDSNCSGSKNACGACQAPSLEL